MDWDWQHLTWLCEVKGEVNTVTHPTSTILPSVREAPLAQKWPNRELRCQRWETTPWSVEWNMEIAFFKKTVDTVTRFHLKPWSSLTSPWLFRSIFFPPGDPKTLFSYPSMFVCLILDITNCRVFEMYQFEICRSSPQRSIRLQCNHTSNQYVISRTTAVILII